VRGLRRRFGGVGLVLLAVAGTLVVLTAVTPIGRYLARAAWEEMKILRGRRSIAAMVADSTVDAAVRGKLALVLEARQFAVDSLKLPAGDAFTQYTQLDRDTLLLVLSGARRDELVAKTWWFPIVGRVPYKGFFGTEDALKAERALAAEGFDTYLRPASAFSTLGWFNDPLLSTTLAADSVDLVNTIIHELTHNLYYAKDDAVFNESFANFVGARGAEWFFQVRGDSTSAQRTVDRWADDRQLAAFWARLYRSLDSAFAADSGASRRPRRLLVRDSIYAVARRTLVDSVGPLLRTIPSAYAERVRLDNAALIARRIYLTDLEAFERRFASDSGDLRKSISTIIGEHRARAP
jgi:predicted aminopeptidase